MQGVFPAFILFVSDAFGENQIRAEVGRSHLARVEYERTKMKKNETKLKEGVGSETPHEEEAQPLLCAECRQRIRTERKVAVTRQEICRQCPRYYLGPCCGGVA